ncbi:hypothetical protein [Pseudomonas saliphila]|uniref:hypothetical protein n=1 Tax=Pseudomonas saliphila TaxID=2586906 RepID=UPI0012385F9F|nr:hypothetical protein [Pseudomonas saliphila]
MKYRHLIALLFPLAVALPASAEWPEGAKAPFVAECIEGAQAAHSAATAKAFCECAADEVSSEFSTAELEEMGSQQEIDPETRQRLIDASKRCESILQD